MPSGFDISLFMLEDKIATRLRELIGAAAKAAVPTGRGNWGSYFDVAAVEEVHCSAETLLESAFGHESSQLERAKGVRKPGHPDFAMKLLGGVLRAALADLEGGYIFKARELIEAEVADDLLGQADELLAAGYKDAAAVIVGGVLERHLRELCARHGIPLDGPTGKPKMMGVMNDDLAKAGVYNAVKKSQVQAWATLRNKAAHGDHGAYVKADVENLLRDVRSFCADVA